MNKKKFLAFEKVRKSGLMNMYDVNEVIFIALEKFKQELTKKDCFDILLNYDTYKVKYGSENNKKH